MATNPEYPGEKRTHFVAFRDDSHSLACQRCGRISQYIKGRCSCWISKKDHSGRTVYIRACSKRCFEELATHEREMQLLRGFLKFQK